MDVAGGELRPGSRRILIEDIPSSLESCSESIGSLHSHATEWALSGQLPWMTLLSHDVAIQRSPRRPASQECHKYRTRQSISEALQRETETLQRQTDALRHNLISDSSNSKALPVKPSQAMLPAAIKRGISQPSSPSSKPHKSSKHRTRRAKLYVDQIVVPDASQTEERLKAEEGFNAECRLPNLEQQALFCLLNGAPVFDAPCVQSDWTLGSQHVKAMEGMTSPAKAGEWQERRSSIKRLKALLRMGA